MKKIVLTSVVILLSIAHTKAMNQSTCRVIFYGDTIKYTISFNIWSPERGVVFVSNSKDHTVE
jgi:hypothetical protein